jgi:hypothetical protein
LARNRAAFENRGSAHRIGGQCVIENHKRWSYFIRKVYETFNSMLRLDHNSNPVSNPDLLADDERKWRIAVIKKALIALQTPVSSPTVF